jgi:toluene monooxygenase system ferredoxin subunit
VVFQRVCSLDDLWENDMAVYEVDGRQVLVVHLLGGEVRAIQPSCPHQAQPLVDGTLAGTVLTCQAHRWEFDVRQGKGVNPEDTELRSFPVKVEQDEIYVDVAGVAPDILFCG